LLPEFRGPHPLFWTFRQGQTETGITIYYLDENMNTGPIALQSPVTLPNGVAGPDAGAMLGEIGGRLLVNALHQLATGVLPLHPQLPGGFHHPAPQSPDFTFSRGWSAQRAFNFIRGTAEWKRPYAIIIKGQVIYLESALFCKPDMTLSQPVIWRGSDILLQMTPGMLRVRLAT
ncbi:MAG: formyltransferase family protein, partial [Anaerolineae bacterium]